AAAALVQNGKLVAAVEEDDLARIRHIGMTDAGGLPYRAIDFCLQSAGISFDRVGVVALDLDPHKLFQRETAYYASRIMKYSSESSGGMLSPHLVDSLAGLKDRLRTRNLIQTKLPDESRLVVVDHNLAHAASAFYPSGWDRAAVIAFGTRGDMRPAALMSGEGHRLNSHREAAFPNSLGMVYGAVTSALGFSSEGDWHKTMWLSATGEPEYLDLFRDMLSVDDKGLPLVNLDYFDLSTGRT